MITFIAIAAAVFFFVVKPVQAALAGTRQPAGEDVSGEERRHQELLATIRGIGR